jgi:tRNA (mo5U34)-methyltransferase
MSELEQDVSDDIPANIGWYHTIDLPSETMNGFFDLRKVAQQVLPTDLSDKRCLDACSATGFWAFEMERRGAAEVIALDVASYADKDWRRPWLAPDVPEIQGEAFRVAKAALGSAVQRVEHNVYDVTPDVLGTFDFVFIGSVLLHLRDPVRALRALHTVTGGELMSFEPILLRPSILHPRSSWGRMAMGSDSKWWTPNAFTHREWLTSAGFAVVDVSWHRQPFGRLHARLPKRIPRSWETLRFVGYERHLGVPSQRLLTRPRVS